MKKKIYVSETDMIKEWDFVKNYNLDPRKISHGSNRKVWWVCEKGHEWQALIFNRAAGKRCKHCFGKKATEENNLNKRFPALAKEWHPTKNGGLTPNDVTIGSSKRVWWACKKGHSWECTVDNKVKHKQNCPKCASLYYDNPILSEEWHPTKNGNLTPLDVYPNTVKKVWWQCSKGHEWESSVSCRNSMKACCPYCSKGRVSKISQRWLDTLNIPAESREVWLGELKFRADGFDSKTNTVYEFLGDYWHGNPQIFSPGEINSHNKIAFGDLYNITIKRFDLLIKNGYKICYIWEDNFNRGKLEQRWPKS